MVSRFTASSTQHINFLTTTIRRACQTIPSPLNFNIQQITTESFHSPPRPEHFHHHTHPPSSPISIRFPNGNNSCLKECTYKQMHSLSPHTSATPTMSGLSSPTVLSNTLRASFGWVVDRTSGQCIARCNGPAHGYKPPSFQSEGYGILSLLHFFLNLSTYTYHTTPKRLTMYTDSESWVKTINAVAWEMFFLNETINTD